MELFGYLVKSGEVREVVALEIDGHCPARDYLIELAVDNPKGWQILSSQIRLSADVPRLQTRDTFKLLDPSRQLTNSAPDRDCVSTASSTGTNSSC